MKETKNIALVAHDNQKIALLEWVDFNYHKLIKHKMTCTGTTGRIIEEALAKKGNDQLIRQKIRKLKSGPLGGDQQLGALIAEGKIDVIFFFWDPMEPQPHDVDVKALLRIAVVYNVPIACNRATADFIISSDLFEEEYLQEGPDYTKYIKRTV